MFESDFESVFEGMSDVCTKSMETRKGDQKFDDSSAKNSKLEISRSPSDNFGFLFVGSFFFVGARSFPCRYVVPSRLFC